MANFATYAVRVSKYETKHGSQVQITFKNGAETKLPAYVRVWAKSDRLYFLNGSPKDYPLGEGGTIQISRQDLCDALERFCGEYSDLIHDEVINYYYVSLAHKEEERMTEARGMRLGTSRESGSRAVIDRVVEVPQIVAIETPALPPANTDNRHKEWLDAGKAICTLHATDVISKSQYDEMRFALLDKILLSIATEVENV